MLSIDGGGTPGSTMGNGAWRVVGNPIDIGGGGPVGRVPVIGGGGKSRPGK